MKDLAKAIARDGEGASKIIEVKVKGALTYADASQAARTIARSNLVKTAVFGNDANWGRVLCALGYSPAEFDPDLVDVYLGDVQVAKGGRGIPFSEEEAYSVLNNKEVTILVNLNQGAEEATAWGCDLTYDYVKINASYRT